MSAKFSEIPEIYSGVCIASYVSLVLLTVCAAGGFTPAATAAESKRHSSGALATMAGGVGRSSDVRTFSLEFVAPPIGGGTLANGESTLAPRLSRSVGTRVESAPHGAGVMRSAVNLEAVVNSHRSPAINPRRYRSPARSAPLASHPQMTMGWTDAVARSNYVVGASFTKASYSPYEAIVPATGGIGLPHRAAVFSAAAIVEPISHPTSVFGNSRLNFSSELPISSFQPLVIPPLGASGLMGRMR